MRINSHKKIFSFIYSDKKKMVQINGLFINQWSTVRKIGAKSTGLDKQKNQRKLVNIF